jgi:hypothetical protein
MKKACLLTYTHNESFFFPIWIKYYSAIFDPSDIYVVNHNGTDGTVEREQNKHLFNRIDLQTHYNHDFVLVHDFIQKKSAELLEDYQGIFLAETDEILYHPLGLLEATDFFLSLPVDVVRTLGYEPIHDKATENSIVDDVPLLLQRKWWCETTYMRKPAFYKSVIHYWDNMHNYDENYTLIDARFKLIHLKMIDYDVMYNRNCQALSEGNFSPYNLENKVGWQNRIETKEEFDKFYEEYSSNRKKIPEKFRNIV